MKPLFSVLALVLLSTTAQARDKQTVLDAPMNQNRCMNTIFSYVASNGLTLSSIGTLDYIVEKEGEKVGNAYFSAGRCYIYLDN